MPHNQTPKSNGGWIFLGIVALAIGVGYLFQHEGGKIFGPRGVVERWTNSTKELSNFNAALDTGVFSHDLIITNESDDLRDVEVSITLHKPDGTTGVVQQSFARWPKSGKQKVNVVALKYSSMDMEGTARIDPDDKPAKIKVHWSWNWGNSTGKSTARS